MRYAGAGAILGHGALRHMDVEVLVFINSHAASPKDTAMGTNPGKRRLGALLHHIAQLSGQLQRARAGHGMAHSTSRVSPPTVV